MVNEVIIVDTGIIAAFYNKKDEHHSRAFELLNNLRKGIYGTGIITDYILDETVTLLNMRTKRPEPALKAGQIIIEEKIGKFFPLTVDLVYKTWKIYQKYVIKGLSFTDCTILAVAEFIECEDVLSFDKEFDGIINRVM